MLTGKTVTRVINKLELILKSCTQQYYEQIENNILETELYSNGRYGKLITSAGGAGEMVELSLKTDLFCGYASITQNLLIPQQDFD